MKIESISSGRVKPLLVRDGKELRQVVSGINKSPISTLQNPISIEINRLGIIGDEQADLTVHGGVEKAVYVYPVEHYAFWKTILEQEKRPNNLIQHGFFGENLTISGINEKEVFVGDQWKIGNTRFSVMKLREPCYKFNAKMGFSSASKLMLQNAYSGWYLRVLEQGSIKAGDLISVTAGRQEISIHQQNLNLLRLNIR